MLNGTSDLFKKFNAISCGPFLSDSFQEIIFPQLKEKMPVGIKEILYLPAHEMIDNSNFDFKMSFLDYRHWYYNDDIFENYIQRIASSHPKHLFVFDKPFDHERPWKIDSQIFEKKMLYRTERILSIKNESPETQLISPFIFSVHTLYKKAYSNYLAMTYDNFDYYSVFCSNDMSDASIGSLDSLLKELLNHKKKPIIIFIAVPCGKNKNIDGYTPFNEKDACEKLVQLINIFQSISQNCYFFYFGIDRDCYDENKKPSPFDFWNNEIPLETYIMKYEWDWYSFLGLTDCNGKVKVKLMKKILDIGEKLNS